MHYATINHYSMTRVTHRAIARQVGVSQSTVSRALAGSHLLPQETIARVRQAAKALGYRPDPTLAAVAQCRWRRSQSAQDPTIGVILERPRGGPEGIGDGDLPVGMVNQAAAMGYQLTVFFRSDYPNSRVLQRTLRARGIRGLVIGPVFDDPPAEDLAWDQFVAVSVAAGRYRPPIPEVRFDHFEAIVLAWEKSVAAGHRRIGIALFDHRLGLIDDDLRAGAAHICQTHRFAHLPPVPPLVYGFGITPGEVASWIERYQIGMVIGFSSNIYWQMHEAGISIPEEVAFCSLHLSREDVRDGIAGCLSSGLPCGAEAIEMLHRGLLANAYGLSPTRITHMLEPVWVDGRSLGQNHQTA